jgi:hypothetical protein
MHLSHVDPRLLALAGVLVLTLITLLAILPELGTLDLALGGGAEAGSQEAVPSTPVVARPAWVADPVAPPSLLAP